MKKRLLHMLLAAAMVVSAVGCGSVKTTNTDQAGNSAVEEKRTGEVRPLQMVKWWKSASQNGTAVIHSLFMKRLPKISIKNIPISMLRL